MDSHTRICDICSRQVEVDNYDNHMQMHILESFRLFQFNDIDDGLFNISLPNLHNVFFAESNNDFPFEQQYTMLTFSEPEEIELTDYEFNILLSEMIGNVKCGIEDISHVSKNIEKTDLNEDELNEICVVCRDAFVEIEKPIVKTICNHIFCKECLQQWLDSHKKCPTCMIDLEDLKKEKIENDKN